MKSHVIDELRQLKPELSKAAAGEMVDSMSKAILAAAKKNPDVRLPGLGTFKVAIAAERTGRNPQTGEPIKIAGGPRLKFKAAKGAV